MPPSASTTVSTVIGAPPEARTRTPLHVNPFRFTVAVTASRVWHINLPNRSVAAASPAARLLGLARVPEAGIGANIDDRMPSTRRCTCAARRWSTTAAFVAAADEGTGLAVEERTCAISASVETAAPAPLCANARWCAASRTPARLARSTAPTSFDSDILPTTSLRRNLSSLVPENRPRANRRAFPNTRRRVSRGRPSGSAHSRPQSAAEACAVTTIDAHAPAVSSGNAESIFAASDSAGTAARSAPHSVARAVIQCNRTRRPSGPSGLS